MTRAFLKHLLLGLLLAGGIALVASEAQAEDRVCRAAAPQIGETLRGPILHVTDGGRLCIALDATPDRWVEVRIEETPLQKASAATPSRGTLMAAAFAHNAVCTVTGVVDGQPVARCEIEGQPLTERLGQPEIAKIGQTWR